MIMATISENLQILKDSTDAIKQAIIDKGGTIEGDISTWADAISGISGGGSTGGPGSIFKITNKLNGQLFGGPKYSTNGKNEVLHTYTFEGGELGSNTIIAKYNPNYTGYEIFPNPYAFGYGVSEYDRAGISTSPMCSYGYFNVYADSQGKISLYSYSSNTSTLTCPLIYIAFDTEGNYDVDFFSVQTALACFLKNTNITLSDYSTKLVQDITYNDELLVWNFDEGKYDYAKPLWIKKNQTSTYYYKVTLDNGTILNLVGSDGKCHRLFSVEDGMFISATDMVGKTTYTESGESKVLSCELTQEEVEFYNIITDYHINLFANGVLTSCRYNNIYPIQDMKFIKDDRMNRAPKWKLYEQFRDYKCLGRYIEGLRLYEQLDIPLEDTIKYCERLESLRKSLDEFEGNEKILKKIEDTEVGWIDRSGNIYGFKHYMPGQYNHIILSDKICKELNVQTDNPSRYLEKLGWVKYTTDFIVSSNDEYINKNQLDVIKTFIKIPGKLKSEGYIKIGSIFDIPINISEFENMDEYSFEFRKQNSRKIWQQEK
jgi:hypothetical protein